MALTEARRAELRTILRGMYVWERRAGFVCCVLGGLALWFSGDDNGFVAMSGWAFVTVGWTLFGWTIVQRSRFASDWIANPPPPKP